MLSRKSQTSSNKQEVHTAAFSLKAGKAFSAHTDARGSRSGGRLLILIDTTDKMEHLLDASESVDWHEFLNSRVGGGFICISDIKPQGHIIQPALASCVLYFLQCLPHTRTLIEF